MRRIAAFIGLGSGCLLYVLYRQAPGGVCTTERRLDGKVVIITGANTGIGKETAIDLSQRGAKVYLGCRDLEKGKLALKEIRSISSNNNVYLKKLDLASFASIRQFVEDFLCKEKTLDILINNAGVSRCPEMRTEDGLEMQIGVNHFGHFLLTNLLLDTMKESSPSRIVNVASLAHRRGSINFDDINMKDNYNADKAYCQSKLANILFTRELHRRLEGSGVTAYALHPGMVNTEIFRHIWLSQNTAYHFLFTPLLWFFKTAKQGAQTSIYCAVEPGIEHLSGQYFADCKIRTPSKASFDDSAASLLWKISKEITSS